ncbi:hypothetical protein Q8W71_20875 [Methylobacterium sp. NEAU 140]|uniref:hypothetical protein n=1 Tax=Methylobacterium sp. NEAU 140 TaxID=3064945 RepID=UPI002732A650|nr:hypothetical protein [Methylobacterium sp. NEAU 140]MDP4025087.1 hypothetical protein [Methylobacterium sp. NEAU 140]
MTTDTVATDLDPAILERLRATAAAEQRPPAQVRDAALRAVLDQSPGARRALLAIDATADAAERAFAAKLIGRSILKAYEGILDARRTGTGPGTRANAALATEDAIEAEAIRMCRI